MELTVHVHTFQPCGQTNSSLEFVLRLLTFPQPVIQSTVQRTQTLLSLPSLKLQGGVAGPRKAEKAQTTCSLGLGGRSLKTEKNSGKKGDKWNRGKKILCGVCGFVWGGQVLRTSISPSYPHPPKPRRCVTGYVTGLHWWGMRRWCLSSAGEVCLFCFFDKREKQ